MTSYRLEGTPTSVRDEGSGPLPSHYEAEFTTSEGERVRRYLTDKGRAAVLRRMDDGQRVFSPNEVQDLTVEPDIEALVAQMEAGVRRGRLSSKTTPLACLPRPPSWRAQARLPSNG